MPEKDYADRRGYIPSYGNIIELPEDMCLELEKEAHRLGWTALKLIRYAWDLSKTLTPPDEDA